MKNLIKIVLLAAVFTIMFIKTYLPLMHEDKKDIPQAKQETSSSNQLVSEVNTKPFYKY